MLVCCIHVDIQPTEVGVHQETQTIFVMKKIGSEENKRVRRKDAGAKKKVRKKREEKKEEKKNKAKKNEIKSN